MRQTSGIYYIQSIFDKKIYIGKTKNIRTRITDHFKMLKKQKHFNRHLQNAFNKYGINNFFAGILEVSDEDLDIKEMLYIQQFNCTNEKFGYNLAIGGQGGFSEASINYMRSLRPGKQVFAFNENGDFIKQWGSISHCASDLKVNPCDVRRTIAQTQRTCKGFVLNSEKKFRLRVCKGNFNRNSIKRFIIAPNT